MCHWLRGHVAFCAGVAGRTDQAGGQHFQLTPMLRIHGYCNSLLAALAAHWVDQQLQIPPPLKPQVRPIRRLPGGLVHSAPVSHELPTDPGSVVFIPAKSKPGMMPSP